MKASYRVRIVRRDIVPSLSPSLSLYLSSPSPLVIFIDERNINFLFREASTGHLLSFDEAKQPESLLKLARPVSLYLRLRSLFPSLEHTLGSFFRFLSWPELNALRTCVEETTREMRRRRGWLRETVVRDGSRLKAEVVGFLRSRRCYDPLHRENPNEARLKDHLDRCSVRLLESVDRIANFPSVRRGRATMWLSERRGIEMDMVAGLRSRGGILLGEWKSSLTWD